MYKIAKITKKNIKVLLRAKGGALIVIFGPLLLILLAGLAFDTSNSYSIDIGTYAVSYNPLSEEMISQLEASSFTVTRYDSEERCIEAIKEGDINTCMVLPEGFTVGDEAKNEITFHLDYSKMNLVWLILETVSTQVGDKSSEISVDLTNVLLHRLDQTSVELEADKKLVTQLTEGSSKLSTEIASSKKRLSGLDLDMQLSDVPIQPVVNATKAIVELAGYSNDYAITLARSLRLKLGGVNTTDENLNSMRTELDQTVLKLQSINTKLDSQAKNLTADANGLQTSLSQLKARFDSASSVRADTVAAFNELEKVLTSDIAALLKLQTSFNKIQSDIKDIKITDAEAIVSPIRTNIKPVTSSESHLDFLFPSLIVLVIMFISLFLSSTLVVMEKSSRAYFRNFIAPTPDIVFVLATYVTSLLFLIVQLIIILAVAAIFFTAQVLSGILTTVMVLLLVGSLFILMGMTIGYLFKSEETSTLGSISIGTIMLFLSSVILPIESMPHYLSAIVKYNPFVMAETMLRQSIIFNYSLVEIWPGSTILLGYAAFFFAVILLSQRHIKRKFGFSHGFSFRAKKA